MTTYPSGPVTPAGEHYLVHGVTPNIWVDSFDGSNTFHLSGGMSIPDPTKPECVHLQSVKGFMAPWKIIDQKGATQDGTTFVDALYDPAEVDLAVYVRGRNGSATRQVLRDFIASFDVKQQSTLNVQSVERGHWWQNVRLLNTIQDPWTVFKAKTVRQKVNLPVRNDNSFWQTYDSVDTFYFDKFTGFTEDFDADYSGTDDLGPGWNLQYTGSTDGYLTTDGKGYAYWHDLDETFTDTREVIAQRADFETESDFQVIQMDLGNFQEWSFPQSAANDVWGRMDTDSAGNWGGNGWRLRLEFGLLTVSKWVNHTEYIVGQTIGFGLPNESYSLVLGFNNDPRQIRVMRDGVIIWAHREPSNALHLSHYGVGYRGVGFGMQAGAAIFTQATPAQVTKIKAGDNNGILTLSGKVFLTNPGDQPMFPRYTLFGPGTFTIQDGPGSDDSVTFGPLLPNQVVQLRSDSRQRTVVDLTQIPPTAQELAEWKQAQDDYVGLVGFLQKDIIDPLKSLFGIVDPQGPMYSLLKGRFSNPIPAMAPDGLPAVGQINVSIQGGTAQSGIIAAGTPLTRYPL